MSGEENNSAPSKTPANSLGDLPSGIQEVLKKFLQSGIDDMLPCKIIAYNRVSNRATVQPMIKLVSTDNKAFSRNQLASVPVFNIGGGNFILSFPLNPGDLGWIKATDRDISNFLGSYNETSPDTRRMHDFDNGVFIPDAMRGWVISGEDTANVVLQNLDGTVKVSLGSNNIKIQAPDNVHIKTDNFIRPNAPILWVTASTSVILSAPVVEHNGVNIGETHTHQYFNGTIFTQTGVPQ
jgi:hypothetical protein